MEKVKVNVGDLIHITKMDGEPMYDGRTGYVAFIDDIGTIHGTWGGCGLIPGTDEYEVISNDNRNV